MSLDATDPYQWRAVRHEQVCRIQDVPEGFILLGFSKPVHGGNSNETLTRLSIVNPGTELLQGIRHFDGMHAHAANFKTRNIIRAPYSRACSRRSKTRSANESFHTYWISVRALIRQHP